MSVCVCVCVSDCMCVCVCVCVCQWAIALHFFDAIVRNKLALYTSSNLGQAVRAALALCTFVGL